MKGVKISTLFQLITEVTVYAVLVWAYLILVLHFLVASISFWAILLVSFIGGVFSGFLGGGAGYIRMPSMVYLLGIPTHIAVGTDLFERDDCDLIVVGSWRVRDSWRNYVIGNMTREIVKQTDRPVLVIRSDKELASLADRLRRMVTMLAGKQGYTRRMSEV